MNTMNETLASWRRELSDELTERILPFWVAMLDRRSGGISFPGRVDGYGRPHYDAGVGPSSRHACYGSSRPHIERRDARRP